MWSPSLDFVYGLSAGIGIWISIELIRLCQHTCHKKDKSMDEVLSILELQQEFIEQLQNQHRLHIQSHAEPGFSH